jgi:hypothetical protein
MDRETAGAFPEYVIPVCAGEPDFRPERFAPIAHSMWGGSVPPTEFAVCFDPAAGFFIRLRCRERNPRAVCTEDDGPVWEDSCVEAFLNFAPERGRDYINIEVNANGAMLCGFGSSRSGRVRLSALGVRRPSARSAAEGDSWRADIFVPLETVRSLFGAASFPRGSGFRGNFYKCGDRTAEPHYGAWARIEHDVPLFHLPDQFGRLVIGSRSEDQEK